MQHEYLLPEMPTSNNSSMIMPNAMQSRIYVHNQKSDWSTSVKTSKKVIDLMHTMNASSRHIDSQNGAKTHPLKKFKAANIEILEE